jgi:hypothetical protein
VLALTAWRCGNGTLADIAAERALQVDPAYQLAGLVLQALQAGMHPSVIEQALAEETTRTGRRPIPTTSLNPEPNDNDGPDRP